MSEQVIEKGYVLCAHKETGKQKQCPKHWFNDPALASRLDWVPMELKKFDDSDTVAIEKAAKEKEASDKAKAGVEEKAAKEKDTKTQNK